MTEYEKAKVHLIEKWMKSRELDKQQDDEFNKGITYGMLSGLHSICYQEFLTRPAEENWLVFEDWLQQEVIRLKNKR